MLSDNLNDVGIKGGTKFQELQDCQIQYKYFQDQNQLNYQDEQIDDECSYDKFKTVQIVSPNQPIFSNKQSVFQIPSSAQLSAQKTLIRKQPPQESISNINYRYQSIQKQQIESNLNKVEDRLILMGRRREEKIEKQREQKYNDMMRPAPSITNKENKPILKRGPFDVYERLYSSGKKFSQSKMFDQTPQLSTYQGVNEIGLEKVIKPMPEYQNYQATEENPYRISKVQSSYFQKQSPNNKQKQKPNKDLQSMVFQNYQRNIYPQFFTQILSQKCSMSPLYLNQSKSNNQSNTCSNSKFDSYPHQYQRPQSTRTQQRGIIDQCMEAYKKKQKNRMNQQLQ